MQLMEHFDNSNIASPNILRDVFEPVALSSIEALDLVYWHLNGMLWLCQ